MQLRRAIAQVVVTTVASCFTWCAFGLIARAWPAAAPVVAAPFVLLVVATPFVVILLHFRFQRPRGSSAALAFVTGLVSCALALLLFVTLGSWLVWFD